LEYNIPLIDFLAVFVKQSGELTDGVFIHIDIDFPIILIRIRVILAFFGIIDNNTWLVVPSAAETAINPFAIVPEPSEFQFSFHLLNFIYS